MSTLSKAQANKIINECFNAIPENIWHGFSPMRDKLYNMELAAEKQHRSGHGSVNGFSAQQAAKYFTVSHLVDGVDQKYTVNDILHIRNECLYAQAYVAENIEALQPFFEFVRNSQFGEVDYSDMMK